LPSAPRKACLKRALMAFGPHPVIFGASTSTCREHSVHFREHSGKFREHSVKFREHSVKFPVYA
jgi:hypothetical protein